MPSKFVQSFRGDWIVAILTVVVCLIVALIWRHVGEVAGTIDTLVAYVALVVSLLSLSLSIHFWRKSFRPIITGTVKTHGGGNEAIAYNLVLLNSGTIPARKIRIIADEESLAQAFGLEATPEKKRKWLACFEDESLVPLLHNGDRVSCSFGTTKGQSAGFWKYKATIRVKIFYEGWFGTKYEEMQEIRILDSESFTSYSWSSGGTRF